jgi:hypothetical protein
MSKKDLGIGCVDIYHAFHARIRILRLKIWFSTYDSTRILSPARIMFSTENLIFIEVKRKCKAIYSVKTTKPRYNFKKSIKPVEVKNHIFGLIIRAQVINFFLFTQVTISKGA